MIRGSQSIVRYSVTVLFSSPPLNFYIINACGEVFSLVLRQTSIKEGSYHGDCLCQGSRRTWIGESFLRSRPQEAGGKDRRGLIC